MNKIFKSRRVRKNINYKKILKLLLISFFCAYFISRLGIFNDRKVINYLKIISLNKIEIPDLKLSGEYLINVSLNSFDKIRFEKEVFKQSTFNKEDKDALVYIYNTHQTEEYAMLENYNLTPTVHTASYILKDKLKEIGIESIVESKDLKEELNKNNFQYKYSYKVSRKWLEELNNTNIKLYIDLHRDSVKYNSSNIIINNKDYAKIMLVVGKAHDYEKSMATANKLLGYVKDINEDITRGIFFRENSIYNQDFSPNLVLIELGGVDSTYESICNSLDVLSLAIKRFLEG